MTEQTKIDHLLKTIEKKTFISFFQDGILDIFLGLIMLACAVNAYIGDNNDNRLIWLMAPAVAVWVVGKYFLTLPRMGYIKVNAERKLKIVKAVIVMASLVLVGVFFAVMEGSHVQLPCWIDLVKSYGGRVLNFLFIFGVFSVIASLLDLNRLYYIGFLYAVGLTPTSMWFPNTVKFSLVGSLIVIPGVFLMVRFLKQHPLGKVEKLEEVHR